MNPLLKEIRHNPLLLLLALVPVVLVAHKLKPDSHTMLFVLSILAIVPLAALMSHATESVASKTGDGVGGLLNATFGNMTELIIALTALKAGEYMLVKASIAGAIVTNTLFMLGMSLVLGGLKYRVQEYNKLNARVLSGMLFVATVALLMPSLIAKSSPETAAEISQPLSLGLAILLIAAYGLSLLFSLKTHRQEFASVDHGEDVGETPWPMALAGYWRAIFIGPMPMDLQFWPGAVVMILIAALTANIVTSNGRSAWFVGVLLLMLYLIYAMTLYMLPPRTA